MPPEAGEPPRPPSAEDIAEVREIIDRIARNRADRINQAEPGNGSSADEAIEALGVGSTVAGLLWGVLTLDPTGLIISAFGVAALLVSWERKRRRGRRARMALAQERSEREDLQRALELLGEPPKRGDTDPPRPTPS